MKKSLLLLLIAFSVMGILFMSCEDATGTTSVGLSTYALAGMEIAENDTAIQDTSFAHDAFTIADDLTASVTGVAFATADDTAGDQEAVAKSYVATLLPKAYVPTNITYSVSGATSATITIGLTSADGYTASDAGKTLTLTLTGAFVTP
ncbi:MAG: hypothetical protein R3Y36_07270 [Spirochaetales bacterium]